MNYSREELYNLSIYEVRKIGQLEGVRSPTSLKKDKLIDEIISITSGVKERYIPTSKKGRPSKAFKQPIFLGGVEIDKKPAAQKHFFDSAVNVCAPNLEEDEIYKQGAKPAGEVEGFVDILNGEFGILRTGLSLDDDFVFLTNSIVKENEIKKGEKIKVSVLESSNGKKIADKLISREREKAATDFASLAPIYPNKVLQFSNNILNTLSPIGAGQRTLICCDDASLLEQCMFELFDGIKKKKFFIIFGAEPEEVEKYKNITNILCIKDSRDFELVKLAVNVLHRYAEAGEDCILFACGLENVKINNEDELSSEILNSFKNTTVAGSVTLIAGASDVDEFSLKGVFNQTIPIWNRLPN